MAGQSNKARAGSPTDQPAPTAEPERFRFLPGNYYHDNPGRYGLVQTRSEMERMRRDPEALIRKGYVERVE